MVRRAREGEQVQTLDGQTRTLDGEMVVIEDGEGPTSIAGLMGGARSEVGEGTTRVLMEVANWHGPAIHRASWALALRSEASARFEKGLAPEQCDHAQALAAQLDGRAVRRDAARPARSTSASGSPRAAGDPAARGARGGDPWRACGPRAPEGDPGGARLPSGEAPDGLDVTVPPLRRADVTREADLIEEVARIDGLEKLPATLPGHRPAGRLSEEQYLRRRAVDALVGRGLYETVGWTFTSRESFGAPAPE